MEILPEGSGKPSTTTVNESLVKPVATEETNQIAVTNTAPIQEQQQELVVPDYLLMDGDQQPTQQQTQEQELTVLLDLQEDQLYVPSSLQTKIPKVQPLMQPVALSKYGLPDKYLPNWFPKEILQGDISVLGNINPDVKRNYISYSDPEVEVFERAVKGEIPIFSRIPEDKREAVFENLATDEAYGRLDYPVVIIKPVAGAKTIQQQLTSVDEAFSKKLSNADYLKSTYDKINKDLESTTQQINTKLQEKAKGFEASISKINQEFNDKANRFQDVSNKDENIVSSLLLDYNNATQEASAYLAQYNVKESDSPEDIKQKLQGTDFNYDRYNELINKANEAAAILDKAVKDITETGSIS